MGNVLKWFKWVFDWRFLPAKFQRWLFSTGTRAVYVDLFGLCMVHGGCSVLGELSASQHWCGIPICDGFDLSACRG